MKRRWFAAAAVVAALAALVIFKELRRPDPSPSVETTTAAESPSVVLVADLREAESACGCGEIIRIVRSASTEGVAVLEVAPGSPASRKYRATVNPTVLFLDPEGTVVSRYEGEAPDTISSIRQRLEEVRRQ